MTTIQSHLTRIIASLPGIKKADLELEHPANPEHGDFSCNIALKLFSDLDQEKRSKLGVDSPRELAFKIVTQLEDQLEKDDLAKKLISKVEVAGPGFINFYLSAQFFLDSLFDAVSQGEAFGQSDLGKGKTWELEHTSPNPNKAMHIGHLRNNLVAMALGRLWEAIGIKVVYEAVDNNRGIAIAKLMWGYLKFARKGEETPVSIEHWQHHPEQWQTPEDLDIRPDLFVDQLYVKAAEDVKSNQEVEDRVRKMVVDWEAEDKPTWALWEHVLQYSYQGQQLTLQRLGNRWDTIWREHEHYKKGKEFVEEGLKKGVFRKTEEGTTITNLQSYGLPDTVVIKADGTALYITQDLALTWLRVNNLEADKYHWVVGPEQQLAFKQMFAVCEQLGFVKLEQLHHLYYGYMSIKGQGKMSSREGNVLYIDDLLDQARDKALALIKNDEIDEIKKQDLAEQIGVGAVKYAILKVSRTSDMAFEMDSALSLEGNSGPYLQYTYARALSVLEKARVNLQKMQELLGEQGESPIKISPILLRAYSKLDSYGIWKIIYQYPQVVEQAAQENEPSLVATYLFQLAQAYNSLYNQQQILVEDQSLKQLLLALTQVTALILKSGLNLLGITAPRRM